MNQLDFGDSGARIRLEYSSAIIAREIFLKRCVNVSDCKATSLELPSTPCPFVSSWASPRLDPSKDHKKAFI